MRLAPWQTWCVVAPQLTVPCCESHRLHAARQCNFPSSRDALLRKNALYSIAHSLWTGTDKLRLHAGRALRLLGVVDVVLPYHDSESEQLKVRCVPRPQPSDDTLMSNTTCGCVFCAPGGPAEQGGRVRIQ